MTIVNLMKLGAAFVLVACSETTETAGAPATAVTRANAFGLACPLGVPGAVVTTEQTADGVALVFLTQPEAVSDLRLRARHAAAMHGPNAHLGLGHDGRHGEGGQHGLQALQLPPSHASVVDVEAGARIELKPALASDRDALVTKVQEGARRMNGAPCG